METMSDYVTSKIIVFGVLAFLALVVYLFKEVEVGSKAKPAKKEDFPDMEDD